MVTFGKDYHFDLILTSGVSFSHETIMEKEIEIFYPSGMLSIFE